jgi:hypothetical protein
MNHNYFTDNPERDAEEYISRKDPRPLIGHCVICNAPLHGSCDGWDCDDGYVIDGDIVCDDHLREYMKKYLIK